MASNSEPTNGTQGTPDGSVAALIKTALELGVTEAARKVAGVAPRLGAKVSEAASAGLVVGSAVSQEIAKAIREDPEAVLQIVKEVWSRGGAKEKELAAAALGKGVGASVPHRALAAARELSRMAKNAKEAGLIGRLSLAPILESQPSLLERAKVFLSANEATVRRATLVALLAVAKTRKQFALLVVEALLLLAEQKEKEVRALVREGIGQIALVHPKETAKAVLAWAKSDPNRARMNVARHVIKSAPVNAKAAVERVLFTGLGLLANGRKTGSTTKRSG